jgi:hypothetical protein
MVAPAVSHNNLPSITRSAPPTLTPNPPITAPPPALRNGPRLTAQQAVHTTGKDEHEATLLADGVNDDQTKAGLNVRNRPAPAPDDVGPDPFASFPATAIRPGPPVLSQSTPVPSRRPNDYQPRSAPPLVVERSVSSPSVPELPATSETSPTLGAMSSTSAQLQPVQGSSNKTVFAILGVGVALILTLIGLGIAFRPPSRGLLLIDVPDSATNVKVSINGKELLEADGSAIKDWPQVREVPAGKVSVMIKAQGYETLTEVVDVKEGNEYTSLKSQPKKKTQQ